MSLKILLLLHIQDLPKVLRLILEILQVFFKMGKRMFNQFEGDLFWLKKKKNWVREYRGGSKKEQLQNFKQKDGSCDTSLETILPDSDFYKNNFVLQLLSKEDINVKSALNLNLQNVSRKYDQILESCKTFVLLIW